MRVKECSVTVNHGHRYNYFCAKTGWHLALAIKTSMVSPTLSAIQVRQNHVPPWICVSFTGHDMPLLKVKSKIRMNYM